MERLIHVCSAHGVGVRVTQDMSKHPNFGMSLQGLDYNSTSCFARICLLDIHTSPKINKIMCIHSLRLVKPAMRLLYSKLCIHIVGGRIHWKSYISQKLQQQMLVDRFQNACSVFFCISVETIEPKINSGLCPALWQTQEWLWIKNLSFACFFIKIYNFITLIVKCLSWWKNINTFFDVWLIWWDIFDEISPQFK